LSQTSEAPGRVVKLPGGQRIDYDRLSPERQAELDAYLAELHEIVLRNPLQGFDPFGKQREFLGAGRVKTKMAVAGNRAGKTEIGVVDDLIQCVDGACLPSWLKPFKCWEPPFKLRVVTMDLSATLFGVMIPKWQKLTPRDQLAGGSWDSAFDKSHRVLRFKNGSSVQFMSADQDREKHAGADLDRVHFDEEPPPPNGYGIYLENRRRLIDRSGQLMFTMTPLFGLSWTYDEIWNRRDDPHVRVVQWSMLDNPHLPPDEVQLELASCSSEKERRAVIYGDFVHFRGRVLEDFNPDTHVVPVTPEDVKNLEVIVGYDPGLSRSGLVWCGFDRDNHMLVFDELYPQNLSVPQIVALARAKNAMWRVQPIFWVIDPAMRIRSISDPGESVQSALLREQIPVVPGQNDRMAGVLEMRRRISANALRVGDRCVNWLKEADRWLVAADEEALEMRAKGSAKGASFTTIGPDHLMDPTRYVCLSRVWHAPVPEPTGPTPRSWKPGEAIPARYLVKGGRRVPVGPMGAMS
jgi:phage terminase large subunit-like protein